MADFELEDKHGNRYRIRQGAGPRFWHPENLGAGSSLLADNLLSAMPANGLQQAHNHFYFNVLIKIPNLPCRPQDALCSALSNSYLTIEKIGTALAINDDEPDPRNELRVKIRNALMAIVAGERSEAAMYQKQMDKETTVMKGVIYTGAFMQGVGSSAWGMVVWLKEVSDVVNPFVKMQHHARALQAAWESEDFTKTYSETYVKGEKRELVEALGFDPTQITEQQIDEAMAMANLVIEDPSLRDMLYQFVKDYAEAQHAIEITNVAGTAAFELILTIIMAAITGGVGAVAAIGSKAHLIKKFQKVGDLLGDFAKATRKLKLEGKKRKAKGNNAKFSDFDIDEIQAKKTNAHGAETGIHSPVAKTVVSFDDFKNSVDDFDNNPQLAEQSYELFKAEKWSELEELFKTHNLNGGWPPNRGAISSHTTTLKPGQKIDRYGGFIDNGTGEFKDFGTFTAKAGEPFENRALPIDTLTKPYKQYEVLKPIPEVQAGEAIPWFGQTGKGLQYELPLSVDDLISKGYLKGI